MFNLLTPLTRGCVKTGTAKPGALSVANLRTHPSTETRIGAVVSVVAPMLLQLQISNFLIPALIMKK